MFDLISLVEKYPATSTILITVLVAVLGGLIATSRRRARPRTKAEVELVDVRKVDALRIVMEFKVDDHDYLAELLATIFSYRLVVNGSRKRGASHPKVDGWQKYVFVFDIINGRTCRIEFFVKVGQGWRARLLVDGEVFFEGPVE